VKPEVVPEESEPIAVLIGEVALAAGVKIGPNCIISDSQIGAGTEIYANSIVDHAIVALCAEATGCMDAINAATLEYIKTRKQFGVPIGKFQVLQHRMVDCFTNAQEARSMTLMGGPIDPRESPSEVNAFATSKPFEEMNSTSCFCTPSAGVTSS